MIASRFCWMAIAIATVCMLAAPAWADGLTPEQARGLVEVRKLAEQVARLYHVPPVEIITATWVGSMDTANTYSPGRHVFLHPRVLTWTLRDALVVRLLAYHVLYWGRASSPSYGSNPGTGDYERVRHEQDREGNAKAVEILTKTGWVEGTALRLTYELLLVEHRAQKSGQRPPRPYRRPACDQIKELLARFPQHRDWTSRLECAPD